MTTPVIRFGGRPSPWFLVFILLPFACCKSAAPSRVDTVAVRFAPKDPLKRDSVTHLRVKRRGEVKDAVVLRGPSAVSALIDKCDGPCVFRASIAPVYNVGDGFDVIVWLSDGGERRKIYSRYVDAARRFEDRNWIPLRIPIEFRAGSARLEIEITGGPLGDLTADWLALAEARISPEAEGR